MNIEKHLILLRGEDRTEDIYHCSSVNGKLQVEFTNHKTYSYNPSNVLWLKNPVSYDSETTVVYQNNQPITGVAKIFDFGDYVRLCFVTSYKKVYRKSELSIEQSSLKNPKILGNFEYLKQLAQIIQVKDDEDMGFLSKQYENLTFVSSKSVLAKYLNPTARDQLNNKSQQQPMPIFPFGFNLSQKAATEKALAEQISIIEGPPGTGKTQTILNIIANAIMNGQSIAIVSNNNAATANVLEKLQKYEVDFIAAYLGNKENKEKFFANQKKTYPEMASWELDSTSFAALKNKLEESIKQLNEMLETKNNIALIKQELSSLSLEMKYFKKYYNATDSAIRPYHSIFKHRSETILSLWLDYQQLIEKKNNISLRHKLKYLLRYGITNFSFYNHSNEQIVSLLQKLYYEQKERELKEKIEVLAGRLERFQFEEAIKEYSTISMKLFKAQLAKKYPFQKERKTPNKDSLWKDFESFNKEYPVILSTTHSLRTCTSPNFLFDYVIMDEASQVDIVTGALALSSAKNAVIVGDLKQLPNVVTNDTADETRRIFERFKLDKAYEYVENSILSSITQLHKDAPKTLLREHYRCHPKIIGFCNQKFYDNELIILTEENEKDIPLVVYKTAKGNHARGKYNQRQIDVIMEEVLPQQVTDDSKESVGVISPFRLQTEKLKETLGNRNIEVDTVHKYQGREKDIIIITTVVNDINDFVNNPNLINVAVSRAINKLVLVISDHEGTRGSNLDDLVKYIEYNNFEVVQSDIYSVFDLLYHSYSERLLNLWKEHKKVSEYESENLMNAVIQKVLKLPEFRSLDHVIHQPLKMLINNPEKLNDEECRFAMNVLTHTDFLIFNKLDKQPILVVEVDGFAFHANNPKQAARDAMKDSILHKYGIPILRIKTNESGEETRLRNKLAQILNGGQVNKSELGAVSGR